MRPIDADALLKKTINNPLHAPYIVEKDIRGMPTIQPEPHEGEWEQVSAQRYFMSASYFYRCSACGVNNVRNTNYCPNCGAKMKGERQK